MTTLAPPPVGIGGLPTARRERGRSLVWLALPALSIFLAFGLIPLLGALGLSFTTWDGIGDINATGLTSWKAALSDPALPHALWVTFEIMILSWLVQTPVSILIGVSIAARERYRGCSRCSTSFGCC